MDRDEQRRDVEDQIPPDTVEALRRWTADGVPPGGFLLAVLSNDLLGAMRRADFRNRASLFSIVYWLENFAPTGSYGDPSVIDEWPKSIRDMKKLAEM